MKLDRYEFKAGQKLETFESLSEWKNGKIIRVVQFTRMNYEGLYNVAFGDRNFIIGELDDRIVTDNGDSEKVLATLVASVYAFADKHQGCWVYTTGSTAARTMLYRMGINKYLEIVSEDFEILGETKCEWADYVKGNDYNAFAVKRKQTKF